MRLLESNAPRRRSRLSTSASVVLHTAVIAAAVVTTARAREAPADEPLENLVWTAPRPVEPSAPAPTARSRSSTGAASGASDALPAPADLVDVGPAIDFDLGDVAPDLARGLADTFTRGLGAATCADCPRGGGGGVGGTGNVFDALAVDRAAAPLRTIEPRYPELLRSAGLSGRVVARFVVDTLGRIERETVQLTASTHDAFSQSVRAALGGMRFRPAEAGGRRVRQLVELPFEFVLR